MVQSTKIIGIDLARTGLIDSGVRIGVNLRKMLTRIYTSIEWVFHSPPKPHSFTNLPSHSCIICTLIGFRAAQSFNDMDSKLIQEIAFAIVTAITVLLANQDIVTINDVLVWVTENSPNLPLNSVKDAIIAQMSGHYTSIINTPGIADVFHNLISNVDSANIATYSNVLVTNDLNITSYIQSDILYKFLSQVRFDSAIYAGLSSQLQNFRR